MPQPKPRTPAAPVSGQVEQEEDELLARLDEKQAELSTATDKLQRCGPVVAGRSDRTSDAELGTKTALE